MSRRIFSALVAVSVASAAIPQALACGYHGVLNDSFSAHFPGSIEVAFALRDAADDGVLDAQSLTPKKADPFAYHRAVKRLQHLRGAFAKDETEGETGRKLRFSLLLVESGLWSRYESDGQDVSLTVHIEKPQDGETVVITGEAVLAAIETGKLSWSEAIQRKLLVIVPGDTGDPAMAFQVAAQAR